MHVTDHYKIKQWKDLQRNIEIKFVNQKGLVDESINSMHSNDSDDKPTQSKSCEPKNTLKTQRSQETGPSLNSLSLIPVMQTKTLAGPKQLSPANLQNKLEEKEFILTIEEVAEENPKCDSISRKKHYRTGSKVAFSDINGKALPKKGVLHSYQLSHSPEYKTTGPQNVYQAQKQLSEGIKTPDIKQMPLGYDSMADGASSISNLPA